MSKNTDNVTELFLRAAVERGDPDQVVAMISKIQELLVAMFALWLIMEGGDHKGHDPETCKVNRELPKVIDSFIDQLVKDVRTHVEMNCAANGIELYKREPTINEKLAAELLGE